MQILLQLSRLHVKNVDENLHIPEDVVSLWRKVVLHEGLLAAAVPQVEHEVAEQPHVRVLHVDGGAEPPRVPGDEVREDDGPHAGLPRPWLPHQ